jgi:hypothetical protein
MAHKQNLESNLNFRFTLRLPILKLPKIRYNESTGSQQILSFLVFFRGLRVSEQPVSLDSNVEI